MAVPAAFQAAIARFSCQRQHGRPGTFSNGVQTRASPFPMARSGICETRNFLFGQPCRHEPEGARPLARPADIGFNSAGIERIESARTRPENARIAIVARDSVDRSRRTRTD